MSKKSRIKLNGWDEAMLAKIYEVLYPVLYPVEPQDIQIQAKHADVVRNCAIAVYKISR